MAHDPQELTLAPAQWTAAVAAVVAECAPPAGGLEDIREEVESGRAAMWTVIDGADCLGVLALRVDQRQAGPEAVIVAVAWAPGRLDIAHAMLDAADQLCSDCHTIRVHTIRPAIARLLAQRHGYGACELVLTKNIRKESHVRLEKQ